MNLADSAAAQPVAGAPAAFLPGADVVACWSDTGVYGSGACPELKEHGHCHHCPVFSAAGLQLLNRPLSAEYRAERTRQFAGEKKESEANTISALLFRVGSEWLGLPATVLQEVTERKPIHSLPHRRRGFIVGLANVRGELLVCISLPHLLGVDNACSLDDIRKSYSRILVVQWEGIRSAFPVDEVHGPHRLHPASLLPLPMLPAGTQRGCARQVVTWNDRAVGLLDPETLFPRINQPFP